MCLKASARALSLNHHDMYGVDDGGGGGGGGGEAGKVFGGSGLLGQLGLRTKTNTGDRAQRGLAPIETLRSPAVSR